MLSFKEWHHPGREKVRDMDITTSKRSHKLQTISAQSAVKENADLIIDYLSQLSVDYVFGIPGGAIEPLYNALARSQRSGGPQPIVARHEAGAAFMADGYARESGKLGVCCATTGPGTTNLITGVACAYSDSTPMLVITAQTSIATFGRGALQESSSTGIDTVAMLEHCTRFSTLVSHADQLPYKLLTAITYAFGNTPGPVHLSIPVDILRAPVNQKPNIRQLVSLQNQIIQPDPNSIKQLATLLKNTKKAVFVLGKGAQDAVPEILAFAEQKNWPLVTTPMGKGLVSSYHPLFKGVFGWGGHQSAVDALKLKQADLIIAVGTVLDEGGTCGWDQETIFSERLIHIDANSSHLSRSPMAQMHIHATPKLVFEGLIKKHKFSKKSQLVSPKTSGFPQQVSLLNKNRCHLVAEKIKPQFLIWHLCQQLPDNTSVVTDSGNCFLWGIHYWMHRAQAKYKNLFLIDMGIGAALADRNTPRICLTGDGSMLMNGNEITVAQQHGLNVIFIILNDHALGMVKHGQRQAKAEAIGFDLPKINFAQFANTMGIVGYRIESVNDLVDLDLQELLAINGPVVLDIVIDGEETPPMDMRLKVLGTLNN